MSGQLFNDRRKSAQTSANYEQLAGRPPKPDASAVAARQPALRLTKSPITGVDALRARTAARGGPSLAILGLAVIALALLFGLAFFLWPSSEPRAERATATSAQKRVDAGPPMRTSAADSSPIHAHEHAAAQEVPELAWEHLLARGDGHAQARRWRPAADDFVALLKTHADDHWQWFRAATLLAWLDDQAAYRRHCAEMLKRFSDTTEPMIADRVAKSCL